MATTSMDRSDYPYPFSPQDSLSRADRFFEEPFASAPPSVYHAFRPLPYGQGTGRLTRSLRVRGKRIRYAFNAPDQETETGGKQKTQEMMYSPPSESPPLRSVLVLTAVAAQPDQVVLPFLPFHSTVIHLQYGDYLSFFLPLGRLLDIAFPPTFSGCPIF